MKPTSNIEAPISFENSSVAFAHLSNRELNFNYWVFKLMNYQWITNMSTGLADWAIRWRLPVSWAAKPTIFKVFCGGETITESLSAVEKLGSNNIGAILDYSVEGQDQEKEFNQTEQEIINVIKLAGDHQHIPAACIKISGIVSNSLLEKLSSNSEMNPREREAARILHERFARICQAAFDHQVPLYVDAEESWIQDAIDRLVESMMARFNKERAIVFQTTQMFRHDRLEYLRKLIDRGRAQGFRIGVKVVRGAYLDKENNRAKELKYPTPIQPSKEASDVAYNEALALSVRNIDWVEVCAGTHNEFSCLYLSKIMLDAGLPNNHPHIYFSQLYGMSDYMSFNLAAAGYNVSKYLPYGPVRSTLPYLIRRAKENTAIAGQMGKEFGMISKEKSQRRNG